MNTFSAYGHLTTNHWGSGRVHLRDGRIVSVEPDPIDPAPSPINGNIPDGLNGPARILRPAVRKGWLEGGHGPADGRRGRDPFVEIGWDRTLDLLAAEINRVRKTHGNEAIFAGSYGWGSAGRFHHPQSQLKRFLNTLGGFAYSRGNYSYHAALVLMPHIVGNFRHHVIEATRLSTVAKHGELVVAFGGLPLRATQISDGGMGPHLFAQEVQNCVQAGVKFVGLTPLRQDLDPALKAEWLAPRPGTDVAVMMGLAHTLMTEGLHDREFLERYTVGFERLEAYLNGTTDGTAKDARWAAEISGIPAQRIRDLAKEMATSRTLLTCTASLQRADWGEQPLWMIVALAAMLGQIGLPGGGYAIGYAVNGSVGVGNRPFRPGVLPQGQNPVDTCIPVAMIAEMLLNGGGNYEFNGAVHRFPNARMVWWAGGNPFHHHQDLNRLHRAFQTPDTIVVNEIGWTATARHADIVLPAAAPEERRDLAGGRQDNYLIPCPRIVEPPGEARTEFETYCDLARRFGTEEAFTEGKSEEDWLVELWAMTCEAAKQKGVVLPDWETFMAGDMIELPDTMTDQVFLDRFRADPEAHSLPTPSGRIELWSEVIDGFGYDDCPGHPVWLSPRGFGDGLVERFPLALVSGQPGTRLHSQYDCGKTSADAKINGREPVLINPKDASARGIKDGDIVEIVNDKGQCLAGARLTDDIAAGCVFLWTGAWWDPDFSHPDWRDRHGNPNTLTHDLRTSRLSQGPASHSAFVEVRTLDGPLPEVEAHGPPLFDDENQSATRDRAGKKSVKLDSTLSKGLRILETLSATKGAKGVSELARELELTKSTVFRLLQTLSALDYVRTTENKQYAATLKTWQVGRSVVDNFNLRELASPDMQRLSSETGEAIYLAVPEGLDVTYIDKIESRQPIRSWNPIGGSAPIHTVGTGKAILAADYARYRRQLVGNLPRFTELTITTISELDREIDDIRDRGFAIDRGEFREKIRSYGGAISLPGGAVVAAIGVSVPETNLSEGDEERIGDLVRRAATNVTRRLARN